MSKLRSKAHIEKKKKHRKLKFSIIVILIIILASGFGWLIWSGTIDIDRIEASGNSIVETGAIVSIVQGNLDSKFAGIIPRRNFIFYSKSKILSEITSMPEIRSATLNVEDGIMHINVEERELRYLWCGNDKCYFMDRAGFIFSEAPIFEGNSYMKFSGLITDNPIGKIYKDESYLNNLAEIAKVFKDAGFSITSIYIVENGVATLYDASGLAILINGDSKSADLSLRLGALTKLHSISDLESAYGVIDMRLSHKLFLKRKDE